MYAVLCSLKSVAVVVVEVFAVSKKVEVATVVSVKEEEVAETAA